MSNLSDRVSYLRGLCEGLKLNAASDEGKVLMQVIEVLGDITKSMDEMQSSYRELSDYVECIDDDLEALELQSDEDDDMDFDYDEDDDEDEDEGDEDEGGSVTRFSRRGDESFFPLRDEEEEDEEEDGEYGMYAGFLCPECGGMFSIDVRNGENQLYRCPHCGKKVKAVPMNSQKVPLACAIDEDDAGDDGDK